MKLEYPLLGLIDHCQTICVAECCGLDAYDFSPIHIASFLIYHTGSIDKNDYSVLLTQLETLEANYGAQGASAKGTTIHEMNHSFSGQGITALVEEIRKNLQHAVQIVEFTEKQRAGLR